MKKDEILAKAREEKSDEMETFVRDKSMAVIFCVMGVCLIIFISIRQELHERCCDLPFTVALGASAGCFYRFARLKNAKNLIIGIITGLCAIVYLILTILGH